MITDKDLNDLKSFIENHQYVYRFLPIEYLFDDLHNEHITFINPIKWSDPFDNYIFNFSQKRSKISFTKNLFCFCLTLNPHSEAYWRAYGKEGFAARIRINTEKLIELINLKYDSFWIGRMKYLRESDLIKNLTLIPNLKNDLSSATVKDSFLKAFYIKRLPFEYENEIRILLKSTPTKNNLKRIKVIPKNIINEIRLDPRIGLNLEKAWKSYLEKFDIKVTKSQLFTQKKIL